MKAFWKGMAITLAISLVLGGFYIALMIGIAKIGYRGEHPELFTVAVNNVFASCGTSSNGEARFDPGIEVLETDDYGRVLFFYLETLNEYSPSLLILQKSDEETASYYRDMCCISIYGDTYELSKDSFSEAEIEALKAANDWNQPINDSKCVSTPIVKHKPEGSLELKDADFEAAIQTYARQDGYLGDDHIYRFSYFSAADGKGRELYYVYGIGRDVKGEGVSPDAESVTYEFAMLFQADGTCTLEGVAEITDPTCLRTILEELKQTNGWGT